MTGGGETLILIGISTITASIVSVLQVLQNSRCSDINCCCGMLICKRVVPEDIENQTEIRVPPPPTASSISSTLEKLAEKSKKDK